MPPPDHAAKARKIRIVYENNAAIIATPNQLPLFGLELFFTKYTISHGMNVNENGI
jgi:hypothetical protein